MGYRTQRFARKVYRQRHRVRSGMSKFGVSLSLPVLAGIAVGFSNLDDKLPKSVVLGAAVAPVKGLGVVKSGAQGIIFGNLLQGLLGRSNSGNLSGGFGGI